MPDTFESYAYQPNYGHRFPEVETFFSKLKEFMKKKLLFFYEFQMKYSPKF